MTSSSRPPVVVLLGGPSAEHDVSVVSGTADRRGAGGRRSRRRAGAHRSRRAVVVAAGRPSAGGPAGRRLRRSGRRSGRTGRSRAGAALDRLAGAAAGAGRVHRPARPVRRGRDRPGPARGGRPGLHGVRRGGVGARHGQGALQADAPRHRPAGRRLARGPRRPLGGRPRRRPDRAGGVRRRHRRRAADGQAGRARELGRDDPGPRRPTNGPRRSTWPSATTTSRSSRPTSPAPATSRSSIIGNDHGRLELFGPGEIVSGHEFYDYAAKYTPGLSETSTRAEVPDATAPGPPQDRPRRVPGDRRRGLRPRRLPARRRQRLPVRDQHDPGVHPDQPLPDDAGRGRLHVRRACAPGSSTWRSSATRRAPAARLTTADLPR